MYIFGTFSWYENVVDREDKRHFAIVGNSDNIS